MKKFVKLIRALHYANPNVARFLGDFLFALFMFGTFGLLWYFLQP